MLWRWCAILPFNLLGLFPMDKALDIIKKYSVCYAIATYCPTKEVWLIGYNHTHGVYNGLQWKQEQIDINLQDQVRQIIRVLHHQFSGLLSENQIAALASLIHEIGVEKFMQSEFPTLLKNKNFILAGKVFMKFNKSGRVISAKKTERRRYEQLLFQGD